MSAPFDGGLPTLTLSLAPARNGTGTATRTECARAASPVPAAIRRLLTAWLGLAVGSLVLAGLFAAVAAFARTPLVHRLFSATTFQLTLVGHVTFAFTVWFVAFAGTLWVYVAWRAGYPLATRSSWAAFFTTAAGAALMAIPAFAGSGRPHLSDYVPSIDHPSFWTGLVLVAVGVSLQAGVYLVAWGRARRVATPAHGAAPEALGMAVGALAMLLAAGVLAVALTRVAP